MPVQFQCQECRQWLEVDDEHVGGKAVCPFCQAVTDVPAQAAPAQTAPPAEAATYAGSVQEPGPSSQAPSGLESDAAGPAEEAADRAGYGPVRFDAEEVGLPGRAAAKARLGWLAPAGLVAAVLGFLLLVIAVRTMTAAMVELVPEDGQLSQQDIAAMQERFAELQAEKPWLMVALFGWIGLSVAGFALSLVALLTPGVPRRGLAWAGVVISGSPFLCICSSLILRTLSG